ncbi:MAG: cache domain-containing protein, partial [Gemmiger sp.]|nr:cache domain-containing protein [Gemmiger sp.]
MRNFSHRLKARVYSIGTSIMLYFVLLISVVILMVSILSYNFSIQDLEGLSLSYTDNLIAEINVGVDSYIDNVKSMSAVICENPDVQALMSLYNTAHGIPLSGEDAMRVEALRESAQRHLRVVAGTRSEITNVAVISKYRDVLLSGEAQQPNPDSDYNLTDWFLNPMTDKEDIFVSPSHVQNLVSGEYRWVISISRAVLDPATGEVTGVMVIDLSFYAIKAICETVQLGKNGYAYLIDDNQNIIYHPQQQLIYAGVKAEPFADILAMDGSYLRTGQNKIYTKNRSSLTGWTTVGVINAGELPQGRTRIIAYYFTLSGLCLFFASLAALIISSSITRPIKNLESTMHQVEEGNLSVQADTKINNEIGHLGNTFNTMIAKIKTLMQTAVANEEAKRKSEINALQAQINPHFLYNTLDSIIWMSASGKSEEVTEMTEALAKLFRTSISQGGQAVP